MEKVFSHPQAIARNMIQTVEQDAAVSGKIQVLGEPSLHFRLKLSTNSLILNRHASQV
jgi:hypothetical protein